VAKPASNGGFNASYSGFGLKPGSTFFVGARYEPSGGSSGLAGFTVGGDGTFSQGAHLACEDPLLGKVSVLLVEAVTAAGTTFVREFPGPTGC
jgi:hypothetical protein